MTVPWIEIEATREQDILAVPGSSEYIWQAIFACQVEILPHEEWVMLKWGFNASALLDEALERQRLFLETQYAVQSNLPFEPPDRRTLAFRFINRPGESLLVSVIGKIQACSKEEAEQAALSYYTELKSTFPYDYVLVPAVTRQDFMRISGAELLGEKSEPAAPAQIKRVELPLQAGRGACFIQGIWQSGPRAHEQIWRSLAGSPAPLLLNISLRSTVLYEKERARLLVSEDEVANKYNEQINQKTLASLKQWNASFVERRLLPWKKFFYIQIHLVSNQRVDENLLRVVGRSLSLSSEAASHPGYMVVRPENGERNSWQKQLWNLEPTFAGSCLPVSRLSEVADLEEVFAVMRLPYSPPQNGFPEMKFITTRRLG